MWEIETKQFKLYTIQIKDDDDKVAPQMMRRELKDKQVVLTPVKWLQAKFNKVELSTYYSEKLQKDVANIKLRLFDDEWEYCLSTAFTHLWRSLLNSLAWENHLWQLTIKIYGKVDDKNIVRPRISVYNDWQMTNWKLSIEEQKKYIEPIKNKKWETISNDYSELDEKLIWFIDEINAKAKYKTVADAEKMIDEAIHAPVEDDLPF